MLDLISDFIPCFITYFLVNSRISENIKLTVAQQEVEKYSGLIAGSVHSEFEKFLFGELAYILFPFEKMFFFFDGHTYFARGCLSAFEMVPEIRRKSSSVK